MKSNLLSALALVCSFFAAAQPIVQSLAPGSGGIGTAVTIKGTGFSASPQNNAVYFGAVRATVTSATDTLLVATVPLGATYQPLSVTTNNLTGYSALPFVPTFTGDNGLLTANSFLPKADFTAGMYPHGLAVADFNNDGKPDVLVSRGSSSTVSVFPNSSSTGNLSFAAKLDFAATGSNHEAAAVGDVDGDGKLDFVLTNTNGTSSVSVYRNTSAGGVIGFAAKTDYGADASPYSVALGDVNNDGKPDLIIANNGSNKITVYRNACVPGSVVFDTKTDYTVGTNPYSVALTDVDGDGKQDVVFTTQGTTSALSVMRNTAAGTSFSFATAVDYASLSGPFVVCVADFDGDGKPDLAAAGSGGNAVLVLKNGSSPGNVSFSSQQYFATGTYPVCVAAADVNGDGKPDIITSNRMTNDVSVLKNSGTGTLAFATHVDYAVNTDPFFVAAGDLDGDERPDLISANSATAFISVLRNMIGDATVPAIQSFTPASGISGTAVTVTGTNFTGATAVKFGGVLAASFTIVSATTITAVVGAGASGEVSVTTPGGTATRAGFVFNGPVISSFSPTVGAQGTIVNITGTNFINVTAVTFGGVPAASYSVISATSISATVANGASGAVAVTTANGTATLAGFSYGSPVVTSFTPLSGAVGTSVTISGTNFGSAAAANTVFFGAVKATVTAATSTQLTVTVPAGATYQPISVTANNLTGYAQQPFVVTFPNPSPQLNAASFSAVGSFATGAYPWGVAICDLNGDGKPDVLTANGIGNNLSVLTNTTTGGNLSFGSKTDYATGPGPRRLATGDLDGDGRPDVVVCNFNSGNASTVSVLRNTSTGGAILLAPAVEYPTGNGSFGVAIADINGDGKPDMIVTSGNSGFFSVFQNTTVAGGAISFAPKTDFTLLFHGDQITVADLDGDRKPDIITSNFGGNSISVFRNTSSGGALSLAPKLDYAVGSNPDFITTGDLDGDNKLDIIVGNYSSGTLSFFKNNSSSGNVSLGAEQTYALGVSDFSVADLNGDGKLDLFTGRRLIGKVSVLENTYGGSGNFSFGGNVDFTSGTYDTFVAAGDLDGDGKPELVASNSTQYSVTVFRNVIGEPLVTALSTTTAGSGTSVAVTGSNFTGATSVKFGGLPAASFTVVSPTAINAVVGGGASGDVSVTTPAGTGILSGFRFIPEIAASGATTFCNGGSVTLTSTAAANNQWYRDGTAIAGATATTYQATASGSYTVRTTGNGLTTASPTAVTVTVVSVPTPVVSVNGNLFTSSAATGNQWYESGTAIAGATAQTYQPTQNGVYTVKVTANGCSSPFSTPVNYVVTGIVTLGTDQSIKAYPSPVKEVLTLVWNVNGGRSLWLTLSDAQGKVIFQNRKLSSGERIGLSGLSQGLYLVQLRSADGTVNKTMAVLKAD